MKTVSRVLCCLFAAGLAVAVPPATGAAEPLAYRHLKTLREARPAEIEFRDEGVSIRTIAFSPDGNSLAAASADRELMLYDLPAGRVRLTLKDPKRYNRVTFSPKGELLVYGGFGARAYLLAKDGAEPLRREEFWTKALAHSPDDALLVAWDGSHHLRLQDASSKRELARFDLFAGMGPIDTGLYNPGVTSLDFSPDGKLLAAGVDLFDDELPALYRTQVWNISSAELKGVFDGVYSRFLSDGKTLVTCNAGKIELRSAETLDRLATFDSPAAVTLCELSADKTIVAAVSREEVLVGTLASRKLSAVLKGHGSPITSIALSRDGKLLATGSRIGAIQLWKSDAE